MTVGTEWIIDAEGCPADVLRDLQAVRSVCEQVISDLNLRVVGEPMWHRFPQPGGVTGLYLLTESHLACHTFPEHGLATFNLYCCRPRPLFAWEVRLGELIYASRITLRSITRGAAVFNSDSIEHHDRPTPEAAIQEPVSTHEVTSL